MFLISHLKNLLKKEQPPHELEHFYSEFRRFQLSQEVYNFDFNRSVEEFFAQVNIMLGLHLFCRLRVENKFRNSRKKTVKIGYEQNC